MSMTEVSSIPKFLSLKDVSQSLGVSLASVSRYCQSGRLPFVRIAGRILVPLSALQKIEGMAKLGGAEVQASPSVVGRV